MKTFITSLKIFAFLTILTGIIYPLFITGIAQLFFHKKSNGSLILRDDIVIGSELIGQQFDSSIYFSSRPSAISYNPQPSGASNFGLTNDKLKSQVSERRNQFIVFNGLDSLIEIPSEMLFASASGLDPHISPEAAYLQVERITKARNLDDVGKQKVIESIKSLTEQSQLSLFGEERINVLLLNLELNKLD